MLNIQNAVNLTLILFCLSNLIFFVVRGWGTGKVKILVSFFSEQTLLGLCAKVFFLVGAGSYVVTQYLPNISTHYITHDMTSWSDQWPATISLLSSTKLFLLLNQPENNTIKYNTIKYNRIQNNKIRFKNLLVLIAILLERFKNHFPYNFWTNFYIGISPVSINWATGKTYKYWGICGVNYASELKMS